MVEIMREWFAAQFGKRVRLTRRAALTRDETCEFVVDDTTFRGDETHCNVGTGCLIMCYGLPSDVAGVVDGKLHVYAISGEGHHFFDVYEDA